MWEWIIAFLTWLSADPVMINDQQPRAAAATQAAYASFATEEVPAPTPSKCVCGGTCKNGFWRPDGRIEQPCPCPSTCDCKNKKGCLSGACPKK
jgi:hypothetical protein